jgi:hypothetical protein
VGAPQRGGRGLADAEEPHLARGHELGHGAPGLLDRERGVDAVLIVEVDVIDAEALQRRVARAAHVVGVPVHHAEAAFGPALVPELGREDHLVAPARDGLADEELVGAEAVDVGGVEEVDAELERAVDGGDGLGVVNRPVGPAHAHAAEPQRGDRQTLTQRA